MTVADFVFSLLHLGALLAAMVWDARRLDRAWRARNLGPLLFLATSIGPFVWLPWCKQTRGSLVKGVACCLLWLILVWFVALAFDAFTDWSA